jgi:hypothetical protein
MKPLRSLLIAILLVCLFHPVFGQESEQEQDYYNVLQTYYLKKDKDIVNKTISFLNNTQIDYTKAQPHLTGFFGALFASDAKIKTDFSDKINKIKDADFKKLFTHLLSTTIDSIYAKTPITPAYNDMNWSSYFATGNTKFLNNIIANMHFDDERKDMNLFMTGASAKWSLCSNAQQDKNVNAYLVSLKGTNPMISEILNKQPADIFQETVDVVKAQKAKGLWK